MLSDLRHLGVHEGDTLMLHASMRAVGGRAEDLLAALEQAVGPSGHLLMLLYSDEDDPLDLDRSPCSPDLGVLAEVFRTRGGVVVNRHPVARMGALGPQAGALVGDPPLHDYYGPGSPLERLLQCGGKVLRLGADRNTVTLVHYAEYLADVPDKRRTTHTVDVVGLGEFEVSCLEDSDGIRPYEGEDYFAVLLDAYLAAGTAQTGPVGGCTAELLDARGLVAFAVQWLETKLA